MEFDQALAAFRGFCGPNLTDTLARIESTLQGCSVERLGAVLKPFGASRDVLAGASDLKRIIGQINVVIHAVGILACLPKILEAGEVVTYVSLGAGNTGRPFDPETDQRIAEFKFIQWQGGAESVRQNGLFKDFLLLAEHDTKKRKYLYVLGTEHPLRFLNGGRALASVLSKDVPLYRKFQAKFGEQYRTVREYYVSHRTSVRLEDVSPWLQDVTFSLDD
jgi:hypothetical protein